MTVTDAGTVLFVRDISTRGQADALASFLTGRGMLVSVSVGDRRGESWALVARPVMTGPIEDE